MRHTQWSGCAPETGANTRATRQARRNRGVRDRSRDRIRYATTAGLSHRQVPRLQGGAWFHRAGTPDAYAPTAGSTPCCLSLARGVNRVVEAAQCRAASESKGDYPNDYFHRQWPGRPTGHHPDHSGHCLFRQARLAPLASAPNLGQLCQASGSHFGYLFRRRGTPEYV
jgi:hypothetical protein